MKTLSPPEGTDARLSDLAFREVMRKLAASVVVITAQNGDERSGLTATAMCSVSTSPESILVCINQSASAAPIILQSKYFAVNVLAQDQEDVARLFSTPKLSPGEKFAGANWSELSSGSPILEGALASLDCEVATSMVYGTHHILVGRVVATNHREGRSLVYSEGQYQTLAAPAPEA